MAKKQLQSGLILNGIAPNILIKNVENTAPFLFKNILNTNGPKLGYLEKLIFYKKNLNQLKNIDLAEYFHICLCAHWATAGTFVPTDVDNQIREGLWKHGEVGKYIEKMAELTIDSWTWDYGQVTNRKSYNITNNQIMSTHEGTWLSVAIGAYCALIKNKRMPLACKISAIIIQEIKKEEQLLLELRDKKDHLNFLRTCALMAHNFGDLDRVIDQWQMSDNDPFKKNIYKLGHKLNESHSPILFYAGLVNKEFLSVENHRHMSLRQPKCLRRSEKYLVPVGPFMDDWGELLGKDKNLTHSELAEIVCAFFEGFKRQDKAFGYVRAFRGLTKELPDELTTLEAHMPFDLMLEIKKSKFYQLAQIPKEEFEKNFLSHFLKFKTSLTDFKY